MEYDEEGNPKDEKMMTFWEHISELRSRVKTSLVVFVVTFFGFYMLSDRLLTFLWNHFIGAYNLTLVAPSVMSGFVTQLNLALILASTYTLPVFMYEMFAFIDPAINRKHKSVALKIIFSATFLFICGVAFVYFIMLPMLLEFFVSQNSSVGAVNLFTIEQFFEFIMFNLFVGGLIFQTPLIIVGLNRIGIVPKEWLVNSRRMAYLVILIISGIITPDHSIISQMVLGGMMIILFEISLIFSK
jgi:sec-independent protein translocase protein TatC